MKVLKLSLVAALAAGSFSALNAIPLEQAIKNVDFTGDLRYRYNSDWSRSKSGSIKIPAGVAGEQNHEFRLRLGAKADVGDGFKIFGQVYSLTKDAGYDNTINSNDGAGGTRTNGSLQLRQAYLQYDMADYGLNFIWGRQELGTIWTDDYVGTAAKVVYSPFEGTAIAAFAVDSFEETQDGDQADFSYLLGEATGDPMTSRLYKYNMYGAAFIGGYDLGGSTLDVQLWGAQLMNTGTLYAADVKYTLLLADDLAWSIRATYLGNSVDDYFKRRGAANGQLVNLYGDIKGYGFDGGLGGIMFGKKDAVTINTIEDVGNAGLGVVGREFLYGRGSWVAISSGATTAAYVNAGYTLPSDLRIGLRYVYGATETTRGSAARTIGGGGDKMEGVVEASYQYNKNLDFLVWYSMLRYDGLSVEDNNGRDSNTKNTFRIQAFYKF
ncbi:major outer membrane protein [uncultured Campylobacter sp.]|uniref:major outer membrane protein n=1 Tax=uncultured Campylobacter sp. TaxID=218934 RepID=UPI00262133E8|nr:major outer membrane protein [uncultured Campylobacter sp.]